MKFGYTHKNHSDKIVLICYNRLGSCLLSHRKRRGQSKTNDRGGTAYLELQQNFTPPP